MAKMRFEEWLWEITAAEILHLHSDNSIFTADMFRADCKQKHQSQSFSGVGARHQNDLAEHAIQTITYMARTFMVQVSLHWSERGVDDLALWGVCRQACCVASQPHTQLNYWANSLGITLKNQGRS
eukprot:CCRYP_003305-RA/>CCRYP_003305-RA protein AED:0.17 eAED:0.17 QI:0/-1/0/1/-1/1/1/0/125